MIMRWTTCSKFRKREGIEMMHRLSMALTVILFAASIADAAEPAPAAATSSAPASDPVNLSVFPGQIQLATSRDYQSVVAVVRRSDDVTLDVTDSAIWKLADERFAKLEGNRVLPLADGETELICQHGTGEVRIPVKVIRRR